MKHIIVKSSIVIWTAIAAISGAAMAQDRADQHPSDQPNATQHPSEQAPDQRDQHNQADQRDQRDQSANAAHNRDQRAAEDNHRVAAANDNDKDMVTRYRHEHPHAAARCHDGFFTTTADRRLACSKHGGIDIWLLL